MSRTLPVYRNGTWIQYPLPPCIDPLWSKSNLFQAASFYATALSKGFPPSESAVLAECYVHKQVYADLQYSKQIERKLASLVKSV
jgi:hypothetical protein